MWRSAGRFRPGTSGYGCIADGPLPGSRVPTPANNSILDRTRWRRRSRLNWSPPAAIGRAQASKTAVTGANGRQAVRLIDGLIQPVRGRLFPIGAGLRRDRDRGAEHDNSEAKQCEDRHRCLLYSSYSMDRPASGFTSIDSEGVYVTKNDVHTHAS